MTSSGNKKDLLLGQYEQLAKLGSGTFGNVYKCLDLKTGEVVAIKKMKKVYSSQEEAFDQREIQVLQQFNHPNLVHAKRIELEGGQLYIVFEHLDMNLTDFMKEKMNTEGRKLSEEEIRVIMKQVLIGLDYIHSKGFLHRDIKPENFIIGTKNYEVKMIDFGTVRDIGNFKPPYTTYVSTRWYRAPEMVLRSHNYGPETDIFAAGCVMAELFTTEPLFPGGSELDQLDTIFKIMGTPSQSKWRDGYKLAQKRNVQLDSTIYKKQPLNKLIPNASSEALKILKKMLKIDPLKRFSAKKLLGDAYFQSIHIRAMVEKIKSRKPMIRTIEVKQDVPKSEGKDLDRTNNVQRNKGLLPNRKQSSTTNLREESLDAYKKFPPVSDQKSDIQKLVIEKKNSDAVATRKPMVMIHQIEPKEQKQEYWPSYLNNQPQLHNSASNVKYQQNQQHLDIQKPPTQRNNQQYQQQSSPLLKNYEDSQRNEFAQFMNNKKQQDPDEVLWGGSNSSASGASGSNRAYPMTMRRDQVGPLSFAERVDQELRKSTQLPENNFYYNNSNHFQTEQNRENSISSPTFQGQNVRFENSLPQNSFDKSSQGSSMLARVASSGILNQNSAGQNIKRNMHLSVKIEKPIPQTLHNSPIFSPLQQVGLKSVALKNTLNQLQQNDIKNKYNNEEKIEPFLLRNDSFGESTTNNTNNNNAQKNSMSKASNLDNYFNYSQTRDLFSPFAGATTTNSTNNNNYSQLNIQSQDSQDSNDKLSLLNKYYQSSQIQSQRSPLLGGNQLKGRSSLNQVNETKEEHMAGSEYFKFNNSQKSQGSYSYKSLPDSKSSNQRGATNNVFMNNANNIFSSPGIINQYPQPQGGGQQNRIEVGRKSDGSGQEEGREDILNSVLNRYKMQIQI